MVLNWILIAVLALLLIFGVLALIAVRCRKGKPRPVDYYNWFIIGVAWMSIGIIWIKDNPFFFIMGLVFMALGLAHKDEWKKNHESNKWKNLNKTERKIRLWMIIALGILVLLGLVSYLIRILL